MEVKALFKASSRGERGKFSAKNNLTPVAGLSTLFIEVPTPLSFLARVHSKLLLRTASRNLGLERLEMRL